MIYTEIEERKQELQAVLSSEHGFFEIYPHPFEAIYFTGTMGISPIGCFMYVNVYIGPDRTFYRGVTSGSNRTFLKTGVDQPILSNP